jgi:hypothetical protein
MARGDYTPEIKSSIGDSPKGRLNKSPRRPNPRETPADVARDKQRGIAEGSPQDQGIDAQPRNQMPKLGNEMSARTVAPANSTSGASPAQGASPAHAAMAASIAHAILGRGGM